MTATTKYVVNRFVNCCLGVLLISIFFSSEIQLPYMAPLSLYFRLSVINHGPNKNFKGLQVAGHSGTHL